MEELFNKKSFEWIVAVYERVTRERQEAMKVTAMLNRLNNGVLTGFAGEGIPAEATPPPSSVNQIEQIKGVKYSRN